MTTELVLGETLVVAAPAGAVRQERELPHEPALSPEAEARIVAALKQRHAPSTARNYRQDWEKFTAWCTTHGHIAMPAHPVVVADYLTDCAGLRTAKGERAYSMNTLARWVAAINYWHRALDHRPPGEFQLVKDTIAGLRRTYAAAGDRPVKRVAPLELAEIEHIIVTLRKEATTWQSRLRERRDSALLLLGLLGAFRRSELSDLEIRDVILHASDGLHMRVRRSKTDQTGQGLVKAAPVALTHTVCGPCTYRRWLDVLAAHQSDGRPGIIRLLRTDDPADGHVCHLAHPEIHDTSVPVFRPIRVNGNLGDTALSGQAIHATYRRAAQAGGLSPAKIAQLGAHSVRAGFVTEALRNGAQPHEIQRQTGHASPTTVGIYAREHNPLTGNAVTRFAR
ncbi:tyrosine-type recombinase/integrase [Aldersonia kunmingensis]|uniref:tyrosine-type recombinase/integrase n=1 Tax=Aldersonia kunmingensis TaxID=408066 RepID=UPI00082D02FD|nr:tyrosine-type recombinase/integrase [Aldersonia kunmingensis]